MRRLVIWVVGALSASLVAATAYMVLPLHGSKAAEAPPPRPVPVTTGIVEAREFPIYRLGLGTVQAFNTVTVKVRVDGELQKVAFREGQDVQVGDLLAQIDPRTYAAQLHQAEADKARDEALLANAKYDLERFSSLAVREFASRQSVDTQKSLVAQYQAAILRDQAAIDNAQVLLGYTMITSPLNGRTGIRLIDQGNIVHANDVGGLVVVTQLDPITVIFTLSQIHLPDIAGAMHHGPLTVFAYDQDNKVRLGEGRLELIDNQIEQGTGSLRLKAVFPNPDKKLWPGQFVNAWLRLSVERGPVVPDAAVQSGPNGSYVFAVRPDGAVEVRPVKIASSNGGNSLVESGLKAGEKIVTDGHYRLRNGSRVVDGAQPKPGATAPAKPPA